MGWVLQTWGRWGAGLGCSPAGATGAVLSQALLLAVRINGKGREVLYLAKGDSVKLGCPYVLEPEDNGPQGVGIEWIQITPERPGPENVVSVTQKPLSHHAGRAGSAGRAGMDQTEPSRAGRAGQDRQGLAGQGRTRQGLEGPDKAQQSRQDRQGLAWQGKVQVGQAETGRV